MEDLHVELVEMDELDKLIGIEKIDVSYASPNLEIKSKKWVENP